MRKSIRDQQVHDYVWQGTNLTEILLEKLKDMDVVLIENLGIGIDPSVTYAFYLYTQYCYTSGDKKRFIYRFHDFVQQRPVNFLNVKKFHHYRFGIVPDWHSMLYPAYPNIRYISINRYDRSRLIEHGIEESNLFYIPNSIDKSIIPPDDRSTELRKKIIEKERIDPHVRFILYPVRCVRRKNIEEAIFLTQFFNKLAEGKATRNNSHIKGKFHLLVSLKPSNEDDAHYADQLIDFVKTHRLPVSIGFNDLVSLEREVDPTDSSKIKKFGIGDMYKVAELVITTSILEGFGFAYLEPWIMDRAVIGRSIPMITPDFQAKGMKLGHLYTAFIVERHDFKDIGQEESSPDAALQRRLAFILKLEKTSVVDRLIESNETSVMATLRLFNEEKRKDVVARNREVAEEAFSQETIGKQLYEVITSA
jgi:glycosyltransferase involved in cell wall biosynthesis